jgi:hypothetical protein
MYRLTVHVENPSFISKEQVMVGKDLYGKPIMKPKKPKCIVNTISLSGMRTLKEVEEKLVYLRSIYKISKFKENKQHTYQNSKEMIYLSHC